MRALRIGIENQYPGINTFYSRIEKTWIDLTLIIYVRYLQDFSRWPDEPFEEMDSTLAVQQYIQQQIRREPANIDLILTPPDAQDEGVWKYEHLR